MWFEGLSYESAWEVENTIQDQIQEGKIEIKHLTQERLKTLKVEIRDTNSHLNIRDIKWNDIWDLFEDGKELTYLWDYKRDDNGKIFLHIQNSSGLKGYASAEYLKWKVNLGKININNESWDNAIESQELLSEKAKLKELYLQIINPNTKKEILQKINNCKTKIECEAILTEINIILPEQSKESIEVLDNQKNELKKNAEKIKDREKKLEILEKINQCTTIEACNILLEEVNIILDNQKNPEWEEINIEEIKNNIDFQFSAFIETIKQIDTFFDTQTSEEKRNNEELLEVNHNALNWTLKVAEKIPELKEKVIEIKLYLATFYADEWEVENSNFSNYKLSNEIAFDVLKDAQWIEQPPKVPDMGEIISSFKGTWVWTYITTEINKWTDISEIFNSSIVKNKTEEQWEKLVDNYKDQLEEYLESLDSNHRDNLDKNQIKALDLLMDVNWAWWSIANSTTDMWDVMWWDFAAIWAWIGTWMATWALVWTAWTPVWTVIWWITGAVVWGVVATGWMMLNHGDNYFNAEDYSKWFIELWINTLMFGAWGAAMKAANAFRWTEAILSARWLKALSWEIIADISIGVSSDVTRAWAYNMNIDLSDAVFNNLVWALIPLATIPGSKAMSKFSEARKQLATETTEIQQKASLLSRLWDKTWAKILIEKFNEKIKSLKGKNKATEKEVKTNKETENNQNTKVEKNTWETIYVHKTSWKEYVFINEGKNWKINAKNENWTRVSVNKDNIELKSKTETKDTKENSTKKQQKTEKSPETGNKNIDVSTLLDKELSTLKNNGKPITHWEYQTQLKNGEYTVTWPNGYKKDFLTRKDAVKALNNKLWNNNVKIDILFSSAHRESLAKLNSLSKGKEFELDGKIVRIKKEWDSFVLQEKNGNNGMKNLEIKNLSPKQQELLLEKIIWSNWIGKLRTMIEKITPEKVFTKSEIDKINKNKWPGFLKSKFNEFKKESIDAWKSTGELIRWILVWKKGWVFSKTTMAWWVLANEAIEAMTNTQDYMDEFISWTHAGNIISNAILMKQVWIIRWLIYSELTDDWVDYISDKLSK